MSKFSSPLSRIWRPFLGWTRLRPFLRAINDLGRLYTGEAALRRATVRSLQSVFETTGDRVVIMKLPHHGSARNFQPDVRTLAQHQFVLDTTAGARNRVSRVRETLEMMVSAWR
jgi:hypothetical protein